MDTNNTITYFSLMADLHQGKNQNQYLCLVKAKYVNNIRPWIIQEILIRKITSRRRFIVKQKQLTSTTFSDQYFRLDMNILQTTKSGLLLVSTICLEVVFLSRSVCGCWILFFMKKKEIRYSIHNNTQRRVNWNVFIFYFRIGKFSF